MGQDAAAVHGSSLWPGPGTKAHGRNTSSEQGLLCLTGGQGEHGGQSLLPSPHPRNPLCKGPPAPGALDLVSFTTPKAAHHASVPGRQSCPEGGDTAWPSPQAAEVTSTWLCPWRHLFAVPDGPAAPTVPSGASGSSPRTSAPAGVGPAQHTPSPHTGLRLGGTAWSSSAGGPG